MASSIPRLYRGDSDLGGSRNLRSLWCSHQVLMTKLGLNQGNGASVMRNGLPRSIGSHSTLQNWQKTHFLSFSEDWTVAHSFMLSGGKLRVVQQHPPTGPWNGHLISFDPTCFTAINPVGAGAFEATWSAPHTVVLPLRGPTTPSRSVCHTILIIDVVTFMAHYNLGHLAPCAAQEKEWVVLPMDPMTGAHSAGQMKAQISHTFINHAEFYELA